MKVELQSRNLDAFVAVAKTLHFGKAAEQLCITPSALSQRIAALESQLGVRLFDRSNNAVTLTDTGERLLRYGQQVESLQDALLGDLLGQHSLAGALTIAGFSSVTRSVLMPALQALQLANPELAIHFRVAHMYELPELLARGQVDLMVSQDRIPRAGYDHVLLGHEHNVLVERSEPPRQDDIYLDHNQADDFTERFLQRHDGRAGSWVRRRFCDDIYGIIDAARLGLGRGVVPLHMLTPALGLRLVPGYDKAWATPVLLQFVHRDYYPAPLRAVRDALISQCAHWLQQNPCGWPVQPFE